MAKIFKFGTILEMINIPIGLYCKIDIMGKTPYFLVGSIVETLDLDIWNKNSEIFY